MHGKTIWELGIAELARASRGFTPTPQKTQSFTKKSGQLKCLDKVPVTLSTSYKSSTKCCLKVDCLITNGEKKFFPTIVKNTGSRNTLITGQNIIHTR